MIESKQPRYFVCVDPYDKLNWIQTILKKVGLFYKGRPRMSTCIFKWKEDGSVEIIK